MENYFFDLDGTLINSEPGLLSAHTHTLEQFHYLDGLRIVAEEGLGWTIGPPLGLTVPKLIGSDDADKVQEYIVTFQQSYWETYYKDFILYDGVAEVFHSLKERGKRLFICTSKPELIARKIVKYLNFGELLCDLVGAKMDERPHEKSDFLQVLCQKYLCEPKQSAMIGDRSYDMQAGKKLEFAAKVGVLYGFGTEEELRASGANYIVERLVEILNIADLQ